MKYSAILVSTAALVSASPRWGRRAQHLVSSGSPYANALDDLNIDYSDNWAGTLADGTAVTKVAGVITIPKYSGGVKKQAISAWVGIDGGPNCPDPNGIWQAGFDFHANGYIKPWYEWYPRYTSTLTGFAVSPGDQVRVTIEATSATAGSTTFENLTTGKSATAQSTAPKPTNGLCETSADWIIEDYSDGGGNEVPTFNFGTISITNTSAVVNGKTVNASGNTPIYLTNKDHKVIAEATIGVSGDVVVKYVGGQ